MMVYLISVIQRGPGVLNSLGFERNTENLAEYIWKEIFFHHFFVLWFKFLRNIFSIVTMTSVIHTKVIITAVIFGWLNLSMCKITLKMHGNPLHYFTWWRHQMETFSALLALCVGNSPVPGEFPTHRPVTRSFDVFFDLCLNKQLSKQWWGWWFETPSRPLWRHCNEPYFFFFTVNVWLQVCSGYKHQF